jgi:hypothetical protein
MRLAHRIVISRQFETVSLLTKEERDHALADRPSQHRAGDTLGRYLMSAAQASTLRRPVEAQSGRRCWMGRRVVPVPALRQNLDAVRLHDRPGPKAGTQPGFVVCSNVPDNTRFDRGSGATVDVFRDTADFWAERKIPFRCFYSFQ